MKYLIYTIQNNLNLKIYVGKTYREINTRWDEHKYIAKGGKEKYPTSFKYIHAALAKHKIENFTFTIIEEFDNNEDACEAETFWINFFRSWVRKIGYNLTMGGEGVVHTPEMIEKARLAQQGEKAYGAKLKDWQVLEIVEKFGKMTQEEIGKLYGVNRGTIGDIYHRKTWTHLTKDLIFEKKKVSAIGSKNPNTKLTDDKVIEILNLYVTGDYFFTEIANIYDVGVSVIENIIYNYTWKHIDRSAYKDTLSNIDVASKCLSKNKVLSIISDHKNYTVTELCDKYKVSRSSIHDIFNYKCWKNLTEGIEFNPKKNEPLKGDARKCNKLKEKEVIEILVLYKNKKYSQAELGKMYNVTRGAIMEIVQGNNWKYIDRSKIDYNQKIDKEIKEEDKSKGNKKLTYEQVVEIIKLYKNNECSITNLAKKYNTDRTNIYYIVVGKTWKHIDRTKI